MIDSNNTLSSKLDLLQLYFERPLVINEEITIQQPKIRQIIDFGEEEFYTMLYVFIGNTTMSRLKLWKQGLDWNKISDYELFSIMVTNLTPKDTYLLFGDLNFSSFEIRPKLLGEELTTTLYSKELQIELDEDKYKEMALGLRTMFGIFPKNEFARTKATKAAMIWEDEQNLMVKEMTGSNNKSTLLPLISACLNHPGFKYKKTELEDVGIYEFMDSVKRLQIYEASTALLKGMYSGFMDSSKINKEDLDFMREIKTSS